MQFKANEERNGRMEVDNAGKESSIEMESILKSVDSKVKDKSLLKGEGKSWEKFLAGESFKKYLSGS